MHEPVRAHLEECLSRPDSVPAYVRAHVEACPECREELDDFVAQSALFRGLAVRGEVEPRPGFYARVMDRIEAERPASIWSILLEPRFGFRLSVASAVLVVLMGVFLFSGEPMNSSTPPMQIEPTTVLTVASGGRQDVPAPVLGVSETPEQVRNEVFVSLATYQE